jgi:hypothetical protein
MHQNQVAPVILSLSPYLPSYRCRRLEVLTPRRQRVNGQSDNNLLKKIRYIPSTHLNLNIYPFKFKNYIFIPKMSKL